MSCLRKGLNVAVRGHLGDRSRHPSRGRWPNCGEVFVLRVRVRHLSLSHHRTLPLLTDELVRVRRRHRMRLENVWSEAVPKARGSQVC